MLYLNKTLDGTWLLCIQHFPCLVSFRCMLGANAEVYMKNILHLFIDCQPRFGIPRGDKMSLALDEPK